MRILRLPGVHHDVNATLVVGKEGTVLVDVGTSWYQLLIQERIEGKLNNGEQLNAVLLTCRRYNHSGGAAFIGEAFDVPIHIHPNGSQALATGDFFTTWASRFDSDMPPTITEEVVDGHRWDLGDGTLAVIETAGHCNDAVAGWVVEKEVLIAGPTLPKVDSPARWDQPTGCLPDLLDSVERLLDLDAKLLVPAHGEAVKGRSAIETVLEKHRSFFAETIDENGIIPKRWPKPALTCNYLTPRPSWPAE